MPILPKKFLGIDIGTSSIKIVELSRFGSRIKLESYGELKAPSFYKKPFRTLKESTLLLSEQDVARAISAIFTRAKIKTRKAIFSIPDFSTFFTWFKLPPMSQEEVSTAVRYEARQHIPLPLSEVALDWQIIEGKFENKNKSEIKILLVAVPRELINQYKGIARAAHLELTAVEAEVFALVRAAAKFEKGLIALIDIGAASTTVSIVDRGVLKRSHSFDSSGNEFTAVISKSLNISYSKAEEIKKKYGLLPISQFVEPIIPYGKDLKQILEPLCDIILSESKKIVQDFTRQENREIQKFILAGGSALLPGLLEYFAEQLKKEVVLANPFHSIFCPPILDKALQQMSPSFAIAVGSALRGLE